MMMQPSPAEMANPAPQSEGRIAAVFYIRNDENGTPQVYGEDPPDTTKANDNLG